MTNSDIHGKYAEEYIEILNAYKSHIEASTKSKKGLMKIFLWSMIVLLALTVAGFIGCSLYVVNAMTEIAKAEGDNIPSVVGALGAVLTTFSALIVEIVKIPELIGEYLFNKGENSTFENVIDKIQTYETEMVKLEVASTKEATKVNENNNDSKLESSSYIDVENVQNSAENELTDETLESRNVSSAVND